MASPSPERELPSLGFMACSSSRFSALPWQWILEHIVDIKDVGTPILKEIMSYVSNVEKNSGLQKRIALRYLEEVLALGKIDAQAIPLVVALTKDSEKIEAQHNPALATDSINSDLSLRVQIEVILAHIREEPRNWQGFGQALDHIFPEESGDARFVERRKELQILWQSQDREKRCLEILETYSINALQHDLFKYITLEKARLEQTFLCQLLRDVLKGQYPLPEGLVAKSFLKGYSKADPCLGDVQTNSVGSDDVTVFCDRNIHGGSEVCIAMSRVDCDSVKKSQRVSCRPEHSSDIQLRERDQDGKAVTSQSPLKSMQNCDKRSCAKDEFNRRIETVPLDVENDSAGVECLGLGSDGNEELCHKCRKGGTLLCCDGCPIAVHARCLGSHSSIPSEQEWYCPVCMQKQAAEAVARAQEKEREAKQRLADFIAGVGNRNTQERLSHSSIRFSSRSEKVSRKSNTVDSDVCAVETDLEKQTTPEIHISEAKRAIQAASSESSKGIEREKEDYNEGKEIENKLPAVPDDTYIATTSNANTNITSLKAKEPVDMNRGQVHDEEGDGHDGDLEEGSEDNKVDDFDIGGQKSKRKRDLSKDSYVKFQSGRTLRGKKFCHGTRRQRVRWSKVEEDTLKEGVKKFSHDNGAWGFQWTRILEFGQEKFHPSRTDVDLKDKWRNLAKSYM